MKPSFDEKALREKLIFETLLHEHTHAIIDEGRENDAPGACRPDFHNGKKALLINESLAEWSALNYFRNDEEMFEIIARKLTEQPFEWKNLRAPVVCIRC